MKELIFLLSKKDNRENIEKLLISHRIYLGEQFEAFVDEKKRTPKVTFFFYFFSLTNNEVRTSANKRVIPRPTI